MGDLIVLALLLDGPRYGYRLKAESGALLGQAPAHNNTMYPMLARFAAEGWVRRQAAPGERGQTRDGTAPHTPVQHWAQTWQIGSLSIAQGT